ncbi:MAG: site-2 protease family protein [Verrucomicrobia bacterium]|nr:MAG: site-2 protease family protein [Verrucomicrobiota bacterium]
MNDAENQWPSQPGVPPPIQSQYQPQYSQPPGSDPTLGQRLKKLFAPIGVALVVIVKFAAKLKFLLPLLKTGGTMLVAFGGYVIMWPWQFALGFVLLILVHECGHLIAARYFGLKVGAPVFIPFMGAFIALKQAPKDAWMEAWVGIGGPLLGTGGALVCEEIFLLTGSRLFQGLAFAGFMVNLINLAPIGQLDGGRIVTALSPWLWLIGFPIMLGILVLSWHNPLALLVTVFILVTSLPRLLFLFRRKSDEERRYFEVSPGRRVVMALMYFGLIAFLLVSMAFTSLVAPGREF